MDRRILSVLSLCAAVSMVAVVGGCETQQAKLRREGVAEYNQGQYDQALKTFEQGLTHDQFKAIDHYYAGVAAMKLDRYVTAEYHLKLAWQADPSLADAKDALTECLLREGNEDEAVNFPERDAAITAKAKPPTGNGNIYVQAREQAIYDGKGKDRLRVAKAYEKIGDLDNARLNYAKAIEVAPEDAEVHAAAGFFYERVGKKGEAAKEYTRTYELNPAYPGVVAALARCGLQPAVRSQ